ncbi:MAG TPA: hypothetical protein DIW43_07440 [Spongiibacteraceae bacterium]|nr:hypothetical protein [Spongiibacteraceae bacterium]HCS27271.1 hypothetical protein [Spongiibacteraceae bacterium]
MRHAVNWVKGLRSKLLYSGLTVPDCTPENTMLRYLTIPLAALILSACSSVPVETDYNPAAPFSSYQRYHWQTETSGSDTTISPFHAQRVRNELTRLLNSQQYREASAGEKPDFLVRYYVSEQVEGYGRRNGSRGSIGVGGGSGGFGLGVSVGIPLGKKRPDRNLLVIIDVLDGSTSQLSWRGTALVNAGHTPEEMAEDMVEAVQAIWKEYPPK